MGERGARRKRDTHLEERGVQELADYAVHWIKLGAIVLGAAVGYLEFRNAQLRGLFGVPGEVLIGYVPGTLFIVYVLVSEIWMKVFRVRIISDLTTIDWFEAHFSLGRQRDCEPPLPHLVGAFDRSLPSNANYGGHGPLRWYTSSSRSSQASQWRRRARSAKASA